jgi:RHS repeat-associated protein
VISPLQLAIQNYHDIFASSTPMNALRTVIVSFLSLGYTFSPFAAPQPNAPRIQWQHTIGGDADDWPIKAIEMPDGSFVIGGSSRSGVSGNKTSPGLDSQLRSIDPDENGGDAWVVKLSRSGLKEWDRTYGGMGTDTLVDNRYQFSSKEIHANSGLYYYGLRYYEPNLQRWLNQDRIGEAGGINLYAFVRNNPLGVIDPYGLDFRLDNASGLFEVSGPLGYLRGDTALEQLGAGGYNAIPLAGNTAISAVNAVGQASAQAIEGLAGFAGWLTEQLGGSSSEADLVRRTVVATSLVLGPKGKPCPQKIRIRHYTNAKGLSGIQDSSIIRASDQDRVFAESARRKPLSPREAESTYGLKRGRGQNYVETDVPANQVSKRYNPKTQADELVIKGDVTLENPSFEKR